MITFYTQTIKNLVLALGAAALFFGFAAPAFALSVVYQETPLFSDTALIPGGSVARTVTITNDESFVNAVYTTADNTVSDGLAELMLLTIADEDTEFFSGTFADFFAANPIALGMLAVDEVEVYTFTASLPEDLAEEMQGKTMSFSLIMGFEGGASTSDGGGSTQGTKVKKTPEPEVAGESTSTPPSFGVGGAFPLSGLAGAVLGAFAPEPEDAEAATEEDVEGTEEALDIAGDADLSIASLLSDADKVFLWLLLLVLISLSWSWIDDRKGRQAELFAPRFGILTQFTLGYVVALIAFYMFGIIEAFWWVFAGAWAIMTTLDYRAHAALSDIWNPYRRNLYYATFGVVFALIGFFTPILAVWEPFAIIAAVSAFLAYLDK